MPDGSSEPEPMADTERKKEKKRREEKKNEQREEGAGIKKDCVCVSA